MESERKGREELVKEKHGKWKKEREEERKRERGKWGKGDEKRKEGKGEVREKVVTGFLN